MSAKQKQVEKEATLWVRVSPDEHRRVKELAARNERTLSGQMRLIVREYLEREADRG